MAFPTVSDADTTSGVVTSDDATWDITYPANIAAGDLLLLLAGVDGIPAAPSATGFTVLLDTASSAALNVLGKVAAGSESGTFTLTLSAAEQGGWMMIRIPAASWFGGTLSAGTTSNVSDGVAAATSAFSNVTTPDPPSLTPAWGAADTLWIAFCAINGNVSPYAVTAWPTSYTNTGGGSSGGTTGAGYGIARRELNATSEDPATFTKGTTSNTAGATLAIRPSGADPQTVTATAVIGTVAAVVAPDGVHQELASPTLLGQAVAATTPTAVMSDQTITDPTLLGQAVIVTTPDFVALDQEITAPALAGQAVVASSPTVELAPDQMVTDVALLGQTVVVSAPSVDQAIEVELLGQAVTVTSPSAVEMAIAPALLGQAVAVTTPIIQSLIAVELLGQAITNVAPIITRIINLPAGHLHIGKFVIATPLYTLENEIVNHDEIDDGRLRTNVVVVDGQQDSWTEYDRTDLLARDGAVNAYFDLPELRTPGDVRQRAVEELQTARSVSSPGGDIAGPVVLTTTRMDPIFWIDYEGNKYQTRIEGKHVEWSQSVEPYQRASIDTGAIIFCPPDETDVTYIARDPFDREEAIGLGTAQTGGSWVIT